MDIGNVVIVLDFVVMWGLIMDWCYGRGDTVRVLYFHQHRATASSECITPVSETPNAFKRRAFAIRSNRHRVVRYFAPI